MKRSSRAVWWALSLAAQGLLGAQASLGAPTASELAIDSENGEEPEQEEEPERELAEAPQAPPSGGTSGRSEEGNSAKGRCPAGQMKPDQEVGRVLRIEDGIVIIERRPEFVLPEGRQIGFHDEVGDERIVGRLVRVNNQTYSVRIHVNEDVHVGEMAYLSSAVPTSTLVAPVPSDYAWEVALALKPWFGLNGGGSGLLVEGHVAWQAAERFRFTLATEPSAPQIGPTPAAAEAYFAPSVTFDIAEMGFGVGVGTYNADPAQPLVGFLFSPILRVGAEDGLMFRARSSSVIAGGLPQFGSFRIDAAIPVYYGTRLLVGGGGGDSGYMYGEIGLEMLLVGNGLRGSWFGTGTFGLGGTHLAPATHARGPYMGLGVKRRF